MTSNCNDSQHILRIEYSSRNLRFLHLGVETGIGGEKEVRLPRQDILRYVLILMFCVSSFVLCHFFLTHLSLPIWFNTMENKQQTFSGNIGIMMLKIMNLVSKLTKYTYFFDYWMVKKLTTFLLFKDRISKLIQIHMVSRYTAWLNQPASAGLTRSGSGNWQNKVSQAESQMWPERWK